MTMPYDENNVFAKIIRGEIPSKKVYEDAFSLAFHDINPKAPIHVLIIPKIKVKTFQDFARDASPEEMKGFFNGMDHVLRILNIQGGYRIMANTGIHSGQEVDHFHLHILGGKHLGPMVCA